MTRRSDHVDTHFAPAGRADPSVLVGQIGSCVNSPMAQAILESLGGHVVVLNQQRQILAASASLLEALKAGRPGEILGRRWGEVMECVHSAEGPDGCGTSRACSCCGAAIGILAVQKDHAPVEAECRMAMRRDGIWQACEFHVRASPLELACGDLVLVVFQDISDRKRRELLESAFVHDLANSVMALTGWSRVLSEETDDATAARRIVDISAHLSDTVHGQRMLLLAESGNLTVHGCEVEVDGFLSSLADSLRAHPASNARFVRIDKTCQKAALVKTDPALLFRVVQNMGVNALEAVDPGSTVLLAFETKDGHPTFSVRNPGAIPEEISRQIFHRSFSTKSKAGRGIGTHAMKILGENYLGGKVGFRSTPDDGTTFFIELPG